MRYYNQTKKRKEGRVNKLKGSKKDNEKEKVKEMALEE